MNKRVLEAGTSQRTAIAEMRYGALEGMGLGDARAKDLFQVACDVTSRYRGMISKL